MVTTGAIGPSFPRLRGPGAGTAGTGGEAGRGRLRRWMVTDEQSTTPVVDETGQVIGEVTSERVDMRPLDEDGDETR